MSNEIREIAKRMRALREIEDLSREDMAERLDITAEDYIKYEAGETDIPISVLFKIAEEFNVEFTALVTGQDPKLHRYTLVRNGKGLDVNRRKDYTYKSLAYNFINKKAEPFLVVVEPKPNDCPIPRNSHPGQEFNYVLEGTLKIVLNDKEIILNEGDSLYFDSSLVHGMQALNNKTAKFLAIIL
ncbi:MAG: helix-turn-helix domain-containing protein [Caldicoprobacterales bacterium]|jgi:transcriptional regulator with XRE-family HTH domain|nr:helix-turn-helix domain-containing protein [Clostridiales bacterium]